MALSASIVTVTTSATQLSQTDTTPSGGQSLLLRNTGSATVYLGKSDVTTSTGYPLQTGDQIAVKLGRAETLYGIVASSTNTVAVFAQGI